MNLNYTGRLELRYRANMLLIAMLSVASVLIIAVNPNIIPSMEPGSISALPEWKKNNGRYGISDDLIIQARYSAH